MRPWGMFASGRLKVNIIINESLFVNIPEGRTPMAKRKLVVAETSFSQL
jgi:hypothetical protein